MRGLPIDERNQITTIRILSYASCGARDQGGTPCRGRSGIIARMAIS
jgi:hypothetical protein